MKKIVLTGGPSGGKTTALSILKETFGGKIALVQEAATLIYSGGFPRKDNSPVHIEHAQNIIFYTVHQLEELTLLLLSHSRYLSRTNLIFSHQL